MNDDSTNSKDSRFLRVFEEGKQFTEELLKENERLRLVAAGLRNEKRDLENKYVKVDVPRLQERNVLLGEENQQLREENTELKNQYSSVEEENWEFAERYIEVERQNSNLINLYVASYRLHSTLEYEEVVRIVKEIIINMIGSEEFSIYLVDDEADRLLLITHEGEKPEHSSLPFGDDLISKSAKSGEPYIADLDGTNAAAGGDPVACIPMKVADKVMGVIVISKLLIQKDGFQAVDHELFEMLGGHAATAIYGSHLFSMSERKRSTLQGFIELLKGGADLPGLD
jgi:nitrate/nitrite-specific signal transduction histidine kinase